MKVDNLHNPILGIDLGTTYSSVARWDGVSPKVYPNKNGDFTTPSVVYLDNKTNKFLVGEMAARMGVMYAENVVHAVKRHMDTKENIIRLGAYRFNPVEVSSVILKELVGDVSAKFPEGSFRPAGVVVTVPYYFKAHQIQNTIEAAIKAGLPYLGVIQEPIAASLSYALELTRGSPSSHRNERILVFDLGGGTFDLTIFNLKETDTTLGFEVVATGGDDHLGGIDFDRQVVEWLESKYRLNLNSQEEKIRKLAIQKLFSQVRAAKEHLSFAEHTYLGIPDVIPGTHIDQDLTRDQFEEIIRIHLDKIREILLATMDSASVSWRDIDRVIMVGGSSRIPAVQRLLENCGAANKIFTNLNQELCVAEGAAIYAAYLTGRLELEKKIQVQTKTSHALGIELSDGSFYPIIQGNRRIPCSSTCVLTNGEDNVQNMEINIYQGSEPSAVDNEMVGRIVIEGLPPRPKGELNILVTVSIDHQQVVSARIEETTAGLVLEEKLRC